MSVARGGRLAIAGAAIAAIALVAYVAFEAGFEHGRVQRPQDDAERAAGRRVLYWHDPMVPGQRFDKPGKSPFMDMELVPVYADDAPGTSGVSIDPRLQQNFGMRTAKAVSGSLSTRLSAVGDVGYNERDVVVVQARASGFVEKLFVRAALDPVRKGQPLAELYVPEWIAAQEEYLAAKRLRQDVDALALGGLADAAAQRMRLAGMSDQQIRDVDAKGVVQTRFVITSPIDGVVGELSARQGMAVATGGPLFRLNGLATVWVNAAVSEAAAADVRPGNAVRARTPALPGVVFEGRVNALLPEVDPGTRTINARIELANPGARLVPGMFATVEFMPEQRKPAVLVPSESVIRTGRRTVVIIAHEHGRFVPVDVETGRESDGQIEIEKGVRAGDDVVVSGQFLIDSEANLKAAIARMTEAPKAADDARAPAGGDPSPSDARDHDGSMHDAPAAHAMPDASGAGGHAMHGHAHRHADHDAPKAHGHAEPGPPHGDGHAMNAAPQGAK